MHSTTDAWDEHAGVLAQSDLLMDDVLSSQPHSNAYADVLSANEAAQTSDGSPLRTVQIQGVEVADVGQDIVDDVAVDTSRGGLSAWIFCRSGLARQYNIFADRKTRQRFVRGDGLLYEEE